ncbi:fibroleukin-like [Dreissena polymorpha]|uniref:fibroleukin-like n=1 Tax=Dreissena polymorpha TaxID=45954 RepID=UPI002264784E|nr:fibroleukin-like [Dreissena polymorpha]
MYFKYKMFLYIVYLVLLPTVFSQMSSETSTSRISERLDRIEENEEDLRAALRNLRKDLKKEIDFLIEDISTLSTRLTGSSGQVVSHNEEQVSKTQHASCDCGVIVSQYENLMMAFKREKSANILLRREFHEMRKQHDFEIGNVSEKFINMDSRLNNAEKTLRLEIDTIKNEKMAQLRSEINTIKDETNAEFQEMKKQQDFEIGNTSEKCNKVETRLIITEKTLRSDIDNIKKETMAINHRYAACQTYINNTLSNFTDVIIHLNELLMNCSLNTLQEISRITSDTAKLKTSNEILKNITDNLIRHPILIPSKSCDSVVKSGEYTIYPDAFPHGVNVYCNLDSTNKGWIVVQRRNDGSVDFNRTWADYKSGFGDISGELWLGNDHIYQLTKNKPRQLRIEMEMFNGTKRYALYSEFNISSESEKYKLHLAGYTGDAGDCILMDCFGHGYGLHNGRPFSTFDRDNDRYSGCCACRYGGGWWFDDCFSAHLNGSS